jgi:hypothetical protein
MSKLAKDTSNFLCADGVHLLGDNVNAIKKIAEALIH